MQPKLERLPTVAAIDLAEVAALRGTIDGKAKPPGSFGRLEDLAIRLALIRQSRMPRIEQVRVLLFAGDHGLAAELPPPERFLGTAAAIRLVQSGQAAINIAARAVGAGISLIDAGVAADLPRHKDLLAEKIRAGTRNAGDEPAMKAEEALDALARGARIANQAIGAGADAIIPAGLGFGGAHSAALVLHRLLPAPLAAFGAAGSPPVVARAAERSQAEEPLEVLREFGGFEIAMMAGAIIGAASRRRPVLIDGLVAGAAAVIATRLRPAARDYCLVGHRAADAGSDALPAALGAEPLLDLGLSGGEGAALAVPLLRAAALLLTDMAEAARVK